MSTTSVTETAPGPTGDPFDSGSAARLASKVRVAVGRLHRRLRQQDRSGITHSMLSVLVSLESGPLTLKDLAAAERVQPPSMTPVVARLEGEGLVVRQIDPSDRRIARVSMTPKGRHLLEHARSRRTAFLAKRIRALSDEDVRVLERATAILERLAGEGP